MDLAAIITNSLKKTNHEECLKEIAQTVSKELKEVFKKKIATEIERQKTLICNRITEERERYIVVENTLLERELNEILQEVKRALKEKELSIKKIGIINEASHNRFLDVVETITNVRDEIDKERHSRNNKR
jgi:hypothetical protein